MHLGQYVHRQLGELVTGWLRGRLSCQWRGSSALPGDGDMKPVYMSQCLVEDFDLRKDVA